MQRNETGLFHLSTSVNNFPESGDLLVETKLDDAII